MPQKTKIKSTRKRRTRVKELPVTQKGLTVKEQKQVKGAGPGLSDQPKTTTTTTTSQSGVQNAVIPMVDVER